MTNEIETVKQAAALLGFKLEPLPVSLWETVLDVQEFGLLTAGRLARARGISPTAASNRLRAAQRIGFLQDAPRGRELVFELSPGVDPLSWGSLLGPGACPRCGRDAAKGDVPT